MSRKNSYTGSWKERLTENAKHLQKQVKSKNREIKTSKLYYHRERINTLMPKTQTHIRV